MATSTRANASSAASTSPVGPPPAITTACFVVAGTVRHFYRCDRARATGSRALADLPSRGERTSTMQDILDYLEVVVPPAFSCDEFEVSAAVVLECQDFVACGALGVAPSELEEALYYASLMDHGSLVAVRCAWEHAAD